MFDYSFKMFTRENKTVTEKNLVNDTKATVQRCLNLHGHSAGMRVTDLSIEN